MTDIPTPHVPATMVNVATLRELALELSLTSSNIPVTQRERVVIGILINRALSLRHPLVDIVREDLQAWEIPKYTALVGWLASYGLVSTYPDAIISIAQYLLGHTQVEVHASIDWDAVRMQYPQL